MSEQVIRFVVSGHVDHGKSTLCGRILYESDYINNHDFEKLKNEAKNNGHPGSEYAYILDICDEEREKAITHDYNSIEFTNKNIKDVKFELIDTPGHKQFIRSLIMGLNSSSANNLIGCLLVSAVENEFAAGMGKGQTKEDAILMRSVGIENVIVLINKMDRYDYDDKVYNDRCNQVNQFVSKLGFKKMEFMMVSGYTGYNINELLNKIVEMYKQININKNSITNTNKEQIISETVNAQIKIINLDTQIICAGYEFILHVNTDEYQVIIDELKQFDIKTKKEINKNFARVNDVINVKIKRLDDKKIELNRFDRIIIRHNDATIGFGKII